MANFGSIVEWVLRLEDRTLAGETQGSGRRRRLDALRRDVCEQPTGALEVIGLIPRVGARMTNEEALEVAKQVYYDRYWTPIHGTQIVSDEFAATLMSFAVNDGVGTAVKLLQVILGMQSVDGKMGPWTLAAISDHDAAVLAEQS